MFENELVEAGLAVFETLTDHVAKKIFEQNNSKDALDSLKKDVFEKLNKSDGKNLLEALDEKLKEDPRARENLEEYSKIRDEIGKTAPRELVEKYGEISNSEKSKTSPKSWVELIEKRKSELKNHKSSSIPEL